MCSKQNEHAIVVDNISKHFLMYARPQDRLWQLLRPKNNYANRFEAVKEVSFTVQRGETVGIIGRNGSGKSTLLQMICGTLQPSSGQIAVRGRVAALLELGAGFNPEFSGRDNVYLNGAILGLTRAQIDERMDTILDFAEIGEFIDQPVKTYSSGMYVRLAFAIIAHVDADVLIIDEALAVGDALFTQKCMRFLRGFKERGTILFVSHDSSAVMNLCDKAVWLHEGRLRAQGNAKAVCEQYLAMLFDGDGHIPDAPTDELQQSESFGKGGATITEVVLCNPDGVALNGVTGGEAAQLRIRMQANEDLDRPIVGFYVKDRLGQTLFGSNTYQHYAEQPVAVAAHSTFTAQFAFDMPVLPPGDYTVAVAIANGTQVDHEQHHWIHDAVLFHSHTTNAIHGLVGIPMQSITLKSS